MEPEIYMKIPKKLSEELRAKFPATPRGYSVVKVSLLDDYFSEFFGLKASPLERKKKKKRKGENRNYDFVIGLF